MKSTFLAALLRNPRQIGAVVPSSQRLANAIAEQLPKDANQIIELGVGTGAITNALLSAGITMQQLILVEKDPHLADLLNKKFMHSTTLCGDASHLKKLMQSIEKPEISAVVSSLPLLNIKRFTRIKILKQIFSILNQDGKLIQYTYSSLPPIHPKLAKQLGIYGSRVSKIYINIPPASVWVYQNLPCSLTTSLLQQSLI